MLMEDAPPRKVDEKDIKNRFCVARHIACLKRFGFLEKTLYEMQK